jgi:uncharacterized membrane protein
MTKQIPYKRIKWKSLTGARNAGAISFFSLSHEKTLLTLQFGYHPDSFVEHIGDALGLIRHRVDVDLASFKAMSRLGAGRLEAFLRR